MKDNVNFNDEIKKSIYTKTVDKILNYNVKKTGLYKKLSFAGICFGVLLLLVFLFVPLGKDAGKRPENNNIQQIITERYEIFFDFLNTDKDYSLF